MLRPNRFAAILGLAGAMAMLPSLSAQQPESSARKDPDASGIAEAIRFHRAEDAAAARQARIEAGRDRGVRSPDRAAAPEVKTRPHTDSASARKIPPPPQNR
jgi:hypothetical protein